MPLMMQASARTRSSSHRRQWGCQLPVYGFSDRRSGNVKWPAEGRSHQGIGGRHAHADHNPIAGREDFGRQSPEEIIDDLNWLATIAHLIGEE